MKGILMKKYVFAMLAVFMLAAASAAYAVTTLTVTPQEVEPGDTITITVSPDGAGTSRFAWIHKGNKYLATVAFPCFQRCFSQVSVQFIIPADWDAGGNYYAKVYDHPTDQYIKSFFTVKRSK